MLKVIQFKNIVFVVKKYFIKLIGVNKIEQLIFRVIRLVDVIYEIFLYFDLSILLNFKSGRYFKIVLEVDEIWLFKKF